jgi:hypothetical protein
MQIKEALVLNKPLLGASSFDIKSPDKDRGVKKKSYFLTCNKTYSIVTGVNLKICISINALVTHAGAVG